MNNRGIALISAYMLIMVLTVLGSSFIARTIQEQRVAEYFANSARAFWVAEAGLQQATRAFRNNDWTTWTADPVVPSTMRLAMALGNSGTYEAEAVGVGGNNVILRSIGYAPDSASPNFAERTVSALYQRASSMFNYAVFANTGASLTGNARTDSYDSRIGPYGGVNVSANGNVATSNTINGAINLTGSSRINGNAETGPGGTVTQGWSCVVTGSIGSGITESASSASVPAELSGLSSSPNINLRGSNSQTLSSGNYSMSSISVSGNSQLTLDGDVNIYLTGSSSLNVTGSGRLIVNGNANIYIDGNASISGAGILSNTQSPANFILYGSSSSNSIQILGSGSVYGGIYAPDTAVSVTGNARLYGAAVGDTVSITGSSIIHYDEALTGASSGAGGYILRYWREDR